MSYQGVRFLSTAHQSGIQGPIDQTQESVDLLQMVPETDHIHRCQDNTGRHSDHDAPPQHGRVLLVQVDQRTSDSDVEDLGRSRETIETSDSASHVHICQSCSREASIFYNQQGDLGHYECHKTHGSDHTSDGSMYFNYLQFANRSKNVTLQNQSLQGSSTTYEPVGHGLVADQTNKDNVRKLRPPKPPKPPRTSKSLNTSKDANTKNLIKSNNSCGNIVFSCCRKSNSFKLQTGLRCNEKYTKCMDDELYDSSPYHHRTSSSNASPALLNNNRARKAPEWSRVKRLLFLVGILLGILVALGGIVIGFIVLAPHRNKAPSCSTPTPVYCDDIGCVHTTAVCLGLILCPNVILTRLCGQNVSSDVSSAGQHEQINEHIQVVTIVPKFEKPIKDADGWVYFSQGSGYDSGSKYTLINRAMMFAAAQKECRTRGGHLPFVNSLREQIFLEDFITQELMNPDIQRHSIGFWLGARRARGSHSGTCSYKQWKWVDVYGRNHGVINGFTVFAKDKPDNHFNPEECLYLSYADSSPENFLKWDDAPCDIPTIGSIKVICEVDDR